MDDVEAVDAALGAAPRLAVHTALTSPATYLVKNPPGDHPPLHTPTPGWARLPVSPDIHRLAQLPGLRASI